mmetsp:Transcript_15919/g.60648  ORF Transcript_15919/g.60648 Transcript_15919/m.60648 type:complete len:292 (+) Transcript_15919:744-1619(+)
MLNDSRRRAMSYATPRGYRYLMSLVLYITPGQLERTLESLNELPDAPIAMPHMCKTIWGAPIEEFRPNEVIGIDAIVWVVIECRSQENQRVLEQSTTALDRCNAALVVHDKRRLQTLVDEPTAYSLLGFRSTRRIPPVRPGPDCGDYLRASWLEAKVLRGSVLNTDRPHRISFRSRSLDMDAPPRDDAARPPAFVHNAVGSDVLLLEIAAKYRHILGFARGQRPLWPNGNWRSYLSRKDATDKARSLQRYPSSFEGLPARRPGAVHDRYDSWPDFPGLVHRFFGLLNRRPS